MTLLVTDHAVVRYCERVLGMDMEGVRRHIHEICAGPAAIGANRIIVDGHKFEIVNGKVVTVTPPGRMPSLTAQRTGRQAHE